MKGTIVVLAAALAALALAPAAVGDVGDAATGSGATAGGAGCAPLPFSLDAVGAADGTATGTFSRTRALSADPCPILVPYSGNVICLHVSGDSAFVLGVVTAGPESLIGQAVRFSVVDNSATGEPDLISGVTPFGPLSCDIMTWDPFAAVIAGDIVVRDGSAPTPIQAIEDLIAETGSAGSMASVHSMVTKLEGAVAALSRGETDAACGKIGAFINEVEAQRGKKLTADEADVLVAAARSASTIAGC